MAKIQQNFVPFLNLLFEQIANSNEYLLAKIGVDTAENEPLEAWGKIFNIIHWCPQCLVIRLLVTQRLVEPIRQLLVKHVRRRHGRRHDRPVLPGRLLEAALGAEEARFGGEGPQRRGATVHLSP